MNDSNWIQFDRDHVWHPFTQHKTSPNPLAIERAKDEYLYTTGGKSIIDGISSWWVTLHGHANEHIASAIREQSTKLEQVIFAGFTHEPAALLSHRLSELWNHQLSKVFFSDDGSTAVEVALKMSLQYHQNVGNTRKTHFIALDQAYHGDTVGAMSVGADSVFTQSYSPFLFPVHRIPSPVRSDGFTDSSLASVTIDALTDLLHQQSESIAAIIVEPMVHGAAGMLVWPKGVLKQIRDVATAYNIHLIADEIMTGFGRTGEPFACHHESVIPDFVTLSKGLTGGFLPLSVTLTSKHIYDGFYSDDRQKTFFHGHSFTANPLGCAAALASLDLFESAESKADRVRIESIHRERRRDYTTIKAADHVRMLGTIFALTVKSENTGYLNNLGPQLYQFFIENGALIRPLGNILYLLPPYCISDSNLHRLHDLIQRALKEKLS